MRPVRRSSPVCRGAVPALPYGAAQCPEQWTVPAHSRPDRGFLTDLPGRTGRERALLWDFFTGILHAKYRVSAAFREFYQNVSTRARILDVAVKQDGGKPSGLDAAAFRLDIRRDLRFQSNTSFKRDGLKRGQAVCHGVAEAYPGKRGLFTAGV